MLVGLRKKHYLMMSLSVTGVLLLLVLSVKPLQPTKPLGPGEAEIGFLRRRIANDDSEGGGTALAASPPPALHDPVQDSTPVSPQQGTVVQQPPPDPPSPPAIRLTEDERQALIKQGILLVNYELIQGEQTQQQQEQEQQQQQLQQQQLQQKQQLQQQQQQQLQQQQQHRQQQKQRPLQQHKEKQPETQHDQWLRQLKLQHQEFLRQRHELQEHHLLEAQLLQQRLQEEEEQKKQLQDQGLVLPPLTHQTSSTSVVSKTSQVSQSAIRSGNGPVPAMPHITYEGLRKQGESIVRRMLRREFMNAKKDTNFTPGEVVDPSQVRRVIIISTWRSGSSFMGDLLRSYPGTFFSFEPLHHLLKNLHLQEGPLVEVVQNLIRGILTCDYNNLDDYVNYMRNLTFLMDHNTRLWNSCAKNRAVCFDKEYLTRICKLMPMNVLKTVRMGLSPAVELLQDPSLDLRVIHLVRDPRGCLHSRKKLSWCQSQACSDPATVCKDLMTDLSLSHWVKQNFPDRYILIRYEDMGLHPEENAREIFKFLQLSYNKYVANFVREHTHPSRKYSQKSAYSTFRDSKATIFAWRGAFNFTTVESIQNVCNDALQHLQLRIFQNEEEYLNSTIPVLLNV